MYVSKIIFQLGDNSTNSLDSIWLDVFVFRRMRDTIATTGRGQFSRVIIAGLSNVYTHYITTYQVLTIKRLHSLRYHLPGSYLWSALLQWLSWNWLSFDKHFHFSGSYLWSAYLASMNQFKLQYAHYQSDSIINFRQFYQPTFVNLACSMQKLMLAFRVLQLSLCQCTKVIQ